MKLSRLDLIYCVILVVFSLVIWLPSRYYPLFWDSTFIVKTATQIYDSNFSKLVSLEQGYAQPTLLPSTLALLWKFFGSSPLVGHYFMAFFLPILLISSYFFIRSKTNREIGLLGAGFIGFTPVVLAEYVNVYADLPMAALVSLSLLLWDKKKYLLWSFVYAAAILTKIPAIAVAPFFFLDALSQKNRHNLAYSLLTPIITFIGWFSYHRIISGWWFVYTERGYALSITRGLSTVLSNWMGIIVAIFIAQGRWVVVVLSLICLFLIVKDHPKQELSNFFRKVYKEIVVILTAGLLFAATGEFGNRYAIFIYILLFTLLLTPIYILIQQKQKYQNLVLGSLLAVLFFFTTIWRPIQTPYTTNVFSPPDDLGIIDYLQVFRWLTSYVQTNQQNTVYYGGFPENISLLEPKMGFVSKPAPFKNCDEYVYDPKITQVIIMHPFSPTLYPCYQIILRDKLQAFTGKEDNGKWIDLYLATASATPAK